MTGREIDRYLKRRGSPMAGLGAVFVQAGKRNGVDPRLLVAISGAESDFGRNIKPGTNNPFGWGPHIPFGSFGEAIDTVARGLRKGYLDEGRTSIPAIGEKWAPGGAANDPTNLNANWAGNVSKFYSELGGRGSATAAPTPLPATTATAPAPAGPSTDRAQLLASVFASNNALLGVPSPANLFAKFAAAGTQPQPQTPIVGSGAVPPSPRPSTAGFNPDFEERLNALLSASGGRLKINSGYRSPERQARLFADAVRKYGSEAAARKWVAPPGRSKHNAGVAADLGGDLSVLSDAFLRRLGLYRPMPYEPWHVEPVGSRS